MIVSTPSQFAQAKLGVSGNIFILLCHQRLCSLMDKIKDSGSLAVGSIPARVTSKVAPNATFLNLKASKYFLDIWGDFSYLQLFIPQSLDRI